MNHFKPRFSLELERELTENFETVQIKKNTVLVNEGDLMKKIPFVEKGLIKVYKEDVDLDRELLLYYVDSGETCMMSLIASLKESRSQVNAKTEIDSEILLIPTEKIKAWQLKYPEWNQFILDTFMERYFELMDTIKELTFDNIENRILKLLTTNSQNLRSRHIDITHKQIAQTLGTTRVVVSRILKKLETQGEIKLLRGAIDLSPGFI
jgi:CRP/FNR family transcriptional regulator